MQYSGNFRKWGDFRLDFVSADFHANAFLKRNIPEIFSVYEKDYNRRVTKPGKVFQENYLDYIIVFFYNDDLNLNHLDKTGSFLEQPSIYPDFFLLISKDEMIHFLNNNVDYCISRIKRNDKNKHKLTVRHGSAFIPISAQKLIEETHCLFGAFDLQKYSDAIKNYLSY